MLFYKKKIFYIRTCTFNLLLFHILWHTHIHVDRLSSTASSNFSSFQILRELRDRNIIINFNAAFGFADARTIYNIMGRNDWGIILIFSALFISSTLCMSNLSLFEIIIKRENEWSHEEQEEIFSSMKKLIKTPLPCKVPIFCCFCSRYYFMFAFLWTTGTCTGEESQEDEGKTYDSIFPFIQHCILSICTLPIPIDAYSRLLISSYPPPQSIHLKKEEKGTWSIS